MRTLRRRIVGTALLAVAVTVGLTTPPALAEEDKPGMNMDPKAGSNASAAIMAAQEPLVQAATRISGLDSDGTLGGIELLVEKKAVNVWWKGAVPPEVNAEIERDRADGIEINLARSKYSQRELVAAARTLPERDDRYRGLVSIGPRKDGAGLRATVLEGYAVDLSAFRYPVTVEVGPALQEWSRFADSPPWWAGGVAAGHNPGSGVCSTGFPVARYFLGFETARGILTAEHCAPGGGIDFFTGASRLIGPAEDAFASGAHSYHSDSLFIRSNSAPRMFDGGVGVGEFSKPIAGWYTPYPGLWLCTSGAATGVHCYVKVDSINSSAQFIPSGTVVFGLALAHQAYGGAAGGFGDSGGPVFTLSGDYSKVYATGLISGGSGPVPCNQAGITGCANQLAFVDIGYVTIAQGVSVLHS